MRVWRTVPKTQTTIFVCVCVVCNVSEALRREGPYLVEIGRIRLGTLIADADRPWL